MLRLLYRILLWILRPKGATVMPDPFARQTDTIDQQLVMAASRRAAAIAARDQADAALIEALADVEACETELGMRARHVDMADRQIDSLLDERVRARATATRVKETA